MIRAFENHQPQIADSAYVDSTAVIIGQVSIGADSSIWPNVVIRGDIHEIQIGECCSIQDSTVIHVTHRSDYDPEGYPTIVGNNVTVGHRVILHGCQIGNNCLIGMGATIMDGVIIEDNVLIGANSLVSPGKRLESGYMYLGSPAKKIRQLTHDEIGKIAYNADHYVRLKNRHIQSL